LTYSYATNGGKLEGNTPTATVNTVGLTPGSYTVTAEVADNGKGSHRQTASCQAAFVVREPPKYPPSISISASPNSLTSGESATIMASGSSPDNRPLSFNCTATAGRLAGNGQVYTLDTTGVPAGAVGVHCTVSDDRSLTSSANASVKVSLPAPPPAAEHVRAIEFKNDVKRPTRVDNQAKGELDRYADALAAQPDAKGVLVGYATARESAPSKNRTLTSNFAAQRAVNAKDYVTKEKGIDPTRVEVRTGQGEDRKVELWIVPAGATFAADGTSVVNEAQVKAVPRVALKTRKTAHKKAAKK
jgi:hypothetical protein